MTRRQKIALLLLILSIALSLLASCGSSRVAATSAVDNVRVKVIERVVEVRDTVEVEIPQVVERTTAMQDSSYLSNDYARSSAVIRHDGGLFHSLETIPQTIRAPTKVETMVKDSIVYREREVINTIEVERKLTTWQRLRLDGFWVLLFAILVYIFIKLK